MCKEIQISLTRKRLHPEALLLDARSDRLLALGKGKDRPDAGGPGSCFWGSAYRFEQ